MSGGCTLRHVQVKGLIDANIMTVHLLNTRGKPACEKGAADSSANHTGCSKPSLLLAKMAVPPARPGLVSRLHLIDKLQRGQQRRLTLVAAAAGWGKTTLVSTWLAQHDSAVAWVSLDGADNDPVRWLSYVVAALTRTIPGRRSDGHQEWEPDRRLSLREGVTRLLNELGQHPHMVTLVLDDYHVITDESIHEAMTMLVEHAPPQVRMVVISRTDPPLSLARLRGRGELLEIRATDLRFTLAETTAFLNESMGVRVKSRCCSSLQRDDRIRRSRTGWSYQQVPFAGTSKTSMPSSTCIAGRRLLHGRAQ